MIEHLPKIMTTKKIAELIGCSSVTTLVYLGRPEFSHIKRIRFGSRQVFKGTTMKDIRSIKNLLAKRRGYKRRLLNGTVG